MVTKVYININEDFLADFMSAILSENREEEFTPESECLFSIAFPPEVGKYEAEAEVEELMFQLGFIENRHYKLDV